MNIHFSLLTVNHTVNFVDPVTGVQVPTVNSHSRIFFDRNYVKCNFLLYLFNKTKFFHPVFENWSLIAFNSRGEYFLKTS
jgi:hypothetical protein